MAENKQRFNDARFINHELSASELKSLKAHKLDAEELDSEMVRLQEEGYKFISKFDNWSRSNAVFLIDEEGRTQNKGLILTGRGSTPLKALRQVLFKHHKAADGSWYNLEGIGAAEIDD